MTADDEKRFRLIIREEFRAALGVDKTDDEKISKLPREDRQKLAKVKKSDDKKARLAKAGK